MQVVVHTVFTGMYKCLHLVTRTRKTACVNVHVTVMDGVINPYGAKGKYDLVYLIGFDSVQITVIVNEISV